MKRYLILLAILAIMVPVFAGTYTIGTGTTSQSLIPVYGYYDYSWSKIIYTADELDIALVPAGPIIAIGFYVSGNPNNYSKNPVIVYMRHTNEDEIDDTYPDNTEFQQVFNGRFTCNGNGWHHLIFNNPFTWDGSSNIEFLIENRSGAWSSGYPSYLAHDTGSSFMVVYDYADSDFPEYYGSFSSNRPNIQIITPQAGPPDPVTLSSPADAATDVFESAILEWNPVIGASGYKLNFGKITNRLQDPILTNYDNGMANSYVHPGFLEFNTTYYWEVIPYNDNGSATGYDTWTFTTRGDFTKDLALRWVEDFSTSEEGQLPEGWFATHDNWSVVGYDEAGGTAPELVLDWDPSILGIVRAITPPLYGDNENGFTLSFKHTIDYYEFGSPYTLKVEATTDLASWATLWSIVPTASVYAAEVQVANDFTAYLGEPFYLAWTFVGNTYDINYWHVDDISIMPIMDGPPAPPILTYPGINAENLPISGFDLTWTPDLGNGSLPDYYAVFMSQDEETLYSDIYFETTETSLNPTTYIDPNGNSSHPVTFEYYDRYFWTVEAYKAGYTSALADPPRMFVIEDDYTIHVDLSPWYEGFEGNTFPPEGWMMVDADSDGYNWFPYGADPHSGNYSAATASWMNGTVLYPDNWLITPRIAIPATGDYQVEYHVAGQDPNYPDEHYGFYISTSGTAPADFTLLREETLEDADWHLRTNLLSDYRGETVHFAFRHFDSSDVFYMKIDDVQVREIPQAPSLSIAPTGFDFGENHVMTPTTPKTFTLTNTGIGTIDIYDGDIWLEPLDEGFILVTEGLPAELSGPDSYSFTVQFIPQTVGPKNATIYIQDNITREIHQITLTGSAVEEPIASVIMLNGQLQGSNDVRLNWASVYGDPGSEGYVHWDDSIHRASVGAGAGQYHVAVKYGREITGLMTDMMIDGVMIHINEQPQTVDYLKIWSGTDASLTPSEMVYEQEVSGLTLGWNYIELITPVDVSPYEAILVGYHINGIDEVFPASTDALAGVNGRGNLVDLSGWGTLNNYSIDGNWLIHTHFAPIYNIAGLRRPSQLTPIAVVANTLSQKGRPNQLLQARNVENAQRALRGFNIYRDNVQINASIVAAYTYLDENLAVDTYQYAVQSVHYGALGPISQSVEVEVPEPPVPLALPYSEDFEAYADNSLPQGWARTSNGLGWEIGTNLSSPFWAIPNHTVYAAANDDAGGQTNDGSVDYLLMHVLDFRIEEPGASVVMSFDSFFTAAYYQIATLEVSTDNIGWDVVYTVPSYDGWVNRSVFLSDYIGYPNVYIRFHANDNGSWASGWAIDNVEVRVELSDGVPPLITHNPHLNTPITDAPYTIVAQVADDTVWNNPIAYVNLYWSIDDAENWSAPVNMTLADGVYTAQIPPQILETYVLYFIEAADSEGNIAETDYYYFMVSNPTWLYYDTGTGDHLTFGQEFGPVVIFDNPFYPNAMQLLATDGSTYFAQQATLWVYELVESSWTPVFADDVDFGAQSYERFELEDEQIIVREAKFLVTYLYIEASNGFLFDYTYDYGTSLALVEGQLYLVPIPGQWSIAAFVTNAPSLEAPVITITLNTEGNPELSWAPIFGANAYQIESATNPYADTWTLYGTTEDTSLEIFDTSPSELFFHVKAVQIDIAKRQNAPTLNTTNENYPGTRALKALKPNNVKINRK